VIVCGQEGLQVLFKLIMTFVVISLDDGLFQRSVHPLNLPIRPGMIDLG
jgi:hypothetical protein